MIIKTDHDLSTTKTNLTRFKYFFSDIKTIPLSLQNNHYPSLDGLRGVAIIMVVFSHLHLSWNFFYLEAFSGPLGVLIFFVLSGFLITTLCIKEKVTTHNISLRNFYLRRSLRIFPVAYLFIFTLLVLNIVFKFNISYISLLGSALYLTNLSYFGKYGSESKTGHFWSLSVEQQFYLIFPFILKRSYLTFVILILSVVFLLPLLVVLQHFNNCLNNVILVKLLHYLTKFQGIAVGCFISMLAFKYPFYLNIKIKLTSNVLAVFLIFFISYDGYVTYENIYLNLLTSFLVGYIIITNITTHKDFVFKALNQKFLKTIGVLSYSIYVWQQIFTYPDSRFPFFINKFPFNLISLAIVSWLSYHFYESYFLKLKSKFGAVKR